MMKSIKDLRNEYHDLVDRYGEELSGEYITLSELFEYGYMWIVDEETKYVLGHDLRTLMLAVHNNCPALEEYAILWEDTRVKVVDIDDDDLTVYVRVDEKGEYSGESI
jgi:hypothetical protein